MSLPDKMRKQFLGVAPQINVLVLNQKSARPHRLAKGLIDLSFQSLLVATANGWENVRAVGIQESSALRGRFGLGSFQALPLMAAPLRRQTKCICIWQFLFCFDEGKFTCLDSVC